MNQLPLAHVIQLQAMYYQLRNHPLELCHLSGRLDALERQEEERVLRG